MHEDEDVWSENPDYYHLELSSTSPLYAKLCDADSSTGECTLPSKVVLDANLVYDDAAKTGAEYGVDTIRTLKMQVGTKTIWYEYIRVPCVEHAYYRDAKRVIKGKIGSSYTENAVRQQKFHMC